MNYVVFQTCRLEPILKIGACRKYTKGQLAKTAQGRKMSGGRLLCADRSGAETV